MQHSRFVLGVLGGVTAAVTVGGVVTYLVAGKNVQHTTVDPIARKLYVKVDGRPAVHNTILEARILGWYNPLPWIGQDISEVSCPSHLEAVAGAKETCTGKADGKRISIPVSVVKVEGTPAEPAVTWKFER